MNVVPGSDLSHGPQPALQPKACLMCEKCARIDAQIASIRDDLAKDGLDPGVFIMLRDTIAMLKQDKLDLHPNEA